MKKIDPTKLELTKLNFEQLKILVDWARAEGWNPGPYDVEVFYATDPDGFYGYFFDNELIAGGSIVSYSGKFGFMGFFIVKPEFRSAGIGRKLWIQRRNLLIERLEPEAAIGMDGVVSMQPFYQKGGFNLAFRDERYQRVGSYFEINNNISPINIEDYENIFEYDLNCFGFERKKFLKGWINLPESFSYKFVTNGVLNGFVILRKAKEGYKIGPLFADNIEVAEELYKACLNSAIGQNIYLDIPVINNKAQELIKKYNATYVFECARMYYGKAPNLPVDNIFGITSFELG